MKFIHTKGTMNSNKRIINGVLNVIKQSPWGEFEIAIREMNDGIITLTFQVKNVLIRDFEKFSPDGR